MKLIDKKELKEWIESWFTKNKYYHPYSKSNNIPIDELYDILEQMPTVEAEPVRHGKWNRNKIVYMECSECGWLFEYYSGLEEEWNYCPHCGAKMDAKGAEE